jgi:hypothetical protein
VSVYNSMSKRRLGEKWRERVSPVFVRYYRALKANAAIGGIKDRKAAKEAFDRQYKELCAATRSMNEEAAKIASSRGNDTGADILKPLDGEVWPWPLTGESGKAYLTNPEACSLFRTLVFLKYGVTFRELVTEIERNLKAYRKWIRIHEDYYRLRSGNRFDDLQLKFNLTHFQVIVRGFAFGLKRLNQWELADCLDEICPCGSEQHSPEYLGKLRTRIGKALESLRERNTRATTIDASGS